MANSSQRSWIMVRVMIAVLIALAGSACVGPTDRDAASYAAQSARVKPDPVQLVANALERRLRLMLTAANAGGAAAENSAIASAGSTLP